MTKVQSIRVLSAAKVNGMLYGILGLLVAPVVLLGPGLVLAGGQRRGFGGAVVLAVFLPFVYACIGFLAGALLAFIYNAISHAIGGIEIDLQPPSLGVQTTSAPAIAPIDLGLPSPGQPTQTSAPEEHE